MVDKSHIFFKKGGKVLGISKQHYRVCESSLGIVKLVMVTILEAEIP